LENIYGKALGVDEIYVHGDSFSFYLFSVIIPNKNYIEKVA